VHNLAIIIPAYKEQYFSKALSSLANQTNKDFKVYIGDDCSPYDLKTIADSFTTTLNINYTRFTNNIGSENLVEQWRRCVQLSQAEDWIWLFSDDDIAAPTCVERFYERVKEDKGAFDVYRFNTVVIDGADNIITTPGRGPLYESSEEMAYNLLLGKRGNAMPDHIFSREVYSGTGGFVFTKYAQAADWATSILFAQKKGIAIIPGAELFWRSSGKNITSRASSEKRKMLQGHLQFIQWLADHFSYLKKTPSTITYPMMINAARINLSTIVTHHYQGFGFSDLGPIISVMYKSLKMPLHKIIYELAVILLRTKKTFKNTVKKLDGLN
jgi:glycosyltransferase involved in cell wall biosynthesis